MFESLSRTGYAIIISLILGTAFLSQQPVARDYGNKLYLGALAQGEAYWAKASDWAGSKFGNKQTGESVVGGEVSGSKVEQQKNKIFQNIFKK